MNPTRIQIRFIVCSLLALLFFSLSAPRTTKAGVNLPNINPHAKPAPDRIDLTALLATVSYADICTAVDHYRDDGFVMNGLHTEVFYHVWTGCTNLFPTYLVAAASTVELESDIESVVLVRVPLEEAVNRAFIAELLGARLGAHPQVATPTAPARVATPTPPPRKVAIVSADTLNVRECAGTNCTIVASGNRGDCFAVIEQTQVGNLPWFRIQDSRNQIGWIAGAPYSILAQNCSVPLPTQQPINTSQACIPFKNHFDMAATVTMTGEGREWTFYVQPKQTHTECFEAGNYTWSFGIGRYSGNGGGYIEAGDHEVAHLSREF